MQKDIGQRQELEVYGPINWSPLHKNWMNSSWKKMGLLLCRSFQAQQQTLLLKSPHMGLSSLCLVCKIKIKHRCTTQVVTPLTYSSLSWSLTISCKVSISGSKFSNWLYLTSISCCFWWWIFHSSINKGRHKNPQIGQILCNRAHRAVYQEIFDSRILGPLQILTKIPSKTQVMIWALLHGIIIKCSRHCSPNRTYKKSALPLKCTNI